jgi:hypothetical protein
LMQNEIHKTQNCFRPREIEFSGEDSSRRRPSLQSLLGMCATEDSRLLDGVHGLLATMFLTQVRN